MTRAAVNASADDASNPSHEDAPEPVAQAGDLAPLKPGRSPQELAGYILSAVAALAPLPFGANDPVSLSVLCIALAAGLGWSSVRAVDRRRKAMLILVGLLAAAFLLVVHEQVSTSPWLARPNSVWAEAGAALGVSLPATVSVMRSEPLFGLGTPLACLAALSLAIVIGADRSSARRVLAVVAWSGLAYAVYGIINALVAPGTVLWLDRPGYFGNVVGTFVNRNTAATYFGSVTAIWLLFLVELIRGKLPERPITYASFSKRVLRRPSRRLIVAFIAFSICLIALLMTTSRAGVVFSLGAMLIAAGVEARPFLPRRFGLIWFGAGGLVFVFAVLQVVGGGLNGRFEASGVSDEGRFDIYRATWAMIRKHPWFGTGLGTFGYAFPAHRAIPPDMQGIWTMAHSTPLETAAELGVPLTVLIGLAFLGGFLMMVRGALRRRRDEVIPLIGATVLALALAHSSIDFSLQIPGFAIVAMTLMGLGAAQSVSSSPLRQDERAGLVSAAPDVAPS